MSHVRGWKGRGTRVEGGRRDAKLGVWGPDSA